MTVILWSHVKYEDTFHGGHALALVLLTSTKTQFSIITEKTGRRKHSNCRHFLKKFIYLPRNPLLLNLLAAQVLKQRVFQKMGLLLRNIFRWDTIWNLFSAYLLNEYHSVDTSYLKQVLLNTIANSSVEFPFWKATALPSLQNVLSFFYRATMHPTNFRLFLISFLCHQTYDTIRATPI